MFKAPYSLFQWGKQFSSHVTVHISKILHSCGQFSIQVIRHLYLLVVYINTYYSYIVYLLLIQYTLCHAISRSYFISH